MPNIDAFEIELLAKGNFPGGIIVNLNSNDPDTIKAQVQSYLTNNGYKITKAVALPSQPGQLFFRFVRDNGDAVDGSTNIQVIREVNRILLSPDAGVRGTPASATGPVSLTIPAPGSPANPSTTGGAGSIPSPFGNNNCNQFDLNFALQQPYFQGIVPEAVQNTNVRVVVLDSSPYGNQPPQFLGRLAALLAIDHSPFVQHFLNNGTPTITLLPDPDATSGTTSSQKEISSHGLFIASIIKTIAPEATVEVHPVLGRDGAIILSDLVDYVNLLKPQAVGNQQLLVNISATTQVTDTADHFASIIPELRPFSGDELEGFATTAEIDLNAHQAIADFAAVNRRIIAAAGNDGIDSVGKPWPGFPARVKGVLSVGAVDRGGVTTDYTNLARIPAGLSADAQTRLTNSLEVTDNGIYAFGGVPRYGVNGLYVHPGFPNLPGQSNDCGAAYWAGTSFATAITTGYMAWLCLRGFTAEQAYQQMLSLPVGADGIPRLLVNQNVT
ncbi:MAG: S8/S53 family peptidase [Chloroflexota bacterium]